MGKTYVKMLIIAGVRLVLKTVGKVTVRYYFLLSLCYKTLSWANWYHV